MKSLRNKADVAQRQRMAQRRSSTDFLNHALEWRRIFAEAWGTFLLVVVAAGGEVVAAPDTVNNRYSGKSGIAGKDARPLTGFMRQSQHQNEPPDEHLPVAIEARGSAK
jgi:hypothetical protein